MTSTEVDHLVVAAASLEQGVAWCEVTLGITPGPGGKHPLMGTHNRVFSIASTAFPSAYFEIIAIDPEAPPPPRRRWFGLDDPTLQQRIAHAPRLVHLVARSRMLNMHRGGLVNVGIDPGLPLAMSRNTLQGHLAWQVLVREDGALQLGGALPTLIQWDGTHPTEHMANSGVELRELQLGGLPPPVRQLLALQGVAHAPAPALRAVLSTPLGDVTLETA
ncbi:VOC family protein [Arthrobacter sp. ISL-28]|uniref:VOC family protein n=1 Tax=Arthrobacter sp. ISL-28 TaxID=2819108 RepID=UPI001BE88A62|nr:VOC family protein [Arthrobacter sp. ISL-28]MBT2523837.1 VOC family protein [Arthrobacter sp. ISL-28]